MASFLFTTSVMSLFQQRLYRSPQNDSAVRVAVLPVEMEHVLQREFRAHICVHQEERRRPSRQDLVSEMINPTPCA